MGTRPGRSARRTMRGLPSCIERAGRRAAVAPSTALATRATDRSMLSFPARLVAPGAAALALVGAGVATRPTGPSFEWTVQKATQEVGPGAPPDAAYERVVAAAQRSNALANFAVNAGAVVEWAWNGFSEEVKE